MSARPLDDAAARDATVTTFDRNVVVVAGAGTGKTSLLVERLLVAVGLDRVRLRQVAAVTFTEKAAGEVRERLAEGLERLARLAGSPAERDERQAADRAFSRLVGRAGVAPAEVGERAARALEDLEGATITTVHGFGAEILRGFPLEAELPPGFEVDTGERADALFEEEWAAFLAQELGPEASRAALWESVLERVPLSTVAAVAREFAREFLGAAVAGGALAGVGVAGRALAEASSGPYDVIVIGGGFAGVTAARNLGWLGRRTLLLEAQARLRGRTFTSKYAGHSIDLGGTWVGLEQPFVTAERMRYGIGVAESAAYLAGERGIYVAGGRRHDVPIAEYSELFNASIRRYMAPAIEVFPRAFEPFYSDAWKKYDNMTDG